MRCLAHSSELRGHTAFSVCLWPLQCMFWFVPAPCLRHLSGCGCSMSVATIDGHGRHGGPSCDPRSRRRACIDAAGSMHVLHVCTRTQHGNVFCSRGISLQVDVELHLGIWHQQPETPRPHHLGSLGIKDDIYIQICIYTHTRIKSPVLSRGPLPLLQAFVAAGCFKPFVADFSRLIIMNILLRGSALFLRVCRGEVCRSTPPSVTNLCREMAAQACYKPNVLIRYHICIYS